ncbi:hypothetical protein R4524_17975 [Acinetobacter baumannii]|nr:hypothetical protein [Acinetobacter baumannii]MDV7550442.1 hypothetical protein [Acinetobacter baumannii]
MRLIFEKNYRKPATKPCLECKKIVDTVVHHSRSFKGHLMHIRCTDNLFSTLFLVSSLTERPSLKKSSRDIIKIHKCLICNEHSSGAKGFKHRIVYRGKELELKIHRTCFFNRFNLKYDEATKEIHKLDQ